MSRRVESLSLEPPAKARGNRLRLGRNTGRLAAATALAFATVVGATVPVSADDESHERGPDPTEELIEASEGPFDIESTSVSSLVSGFGGGEIYYPTDTSEGTFGGGVLAPGYTASSSSLSWLGERLATHGFVAFTIDTNSRFDQPNSRGGQMQAALDYLVESSDASEYVDGDRLAVMGHSMGGGGTLAAADDNPDLQAAIPLTGWHTRKDWSSVEVPTMVIGAENDTTASVSSHSIPFYESLSEDLNRAYLELDGAGHFAPNFSNTTIGKYSVSWLKRFVDNDERYDQFLCPPPEVDSDISDYRDSCPH